MLISSISRFMRHALQTYILFCGIFNSIHLAEYTAKHSTEIRSNRRSAITTCIHHQRYYGLFASIGIVLAGDIQTVHLNLDCICANVFCCIVRSFQYNHEVRLSAATLKHLHTRLRGTASASSFGGRKCHYS